jgi:hypothetical protein
MSMENAIPPAVFVPINESSKPIIVHNTEAGRRLAETVLEVTRDVRAREEKQ